MVTTRYHLSFLGLLVCSLVVAGLRQPACGNDRQPAPGVVVLTDGRAYSGMVSQVPGGYRVANVGSDQIFPFNYVRLTAESLTAAYETLRDNMQQPTATDHLSLAEWCLTYNLIKEARTEVTKALRLEPARAEALVLLQRIDQQFAASSPLIVEPSKTIASISAEAMIRTEERTATGLTRSTQEKFIRHVQPLLMNKCGNAQCHGTAATNDFQITPVRLSTSTHRLASEANLEKVLQFIDSSAPSQSPILRKPGETTDHHRDLFLGNRQHEQYRILRDWVLTAAKERGSVPASAQKVESVATANHEIEPVQQIPSEIQQTSGESPKPSASLPTLSEHDYLDLLRQDLRPDPFDPNVFNQKVHGLNISDSVNGNTPR